MSNTDAPTSRAPSGSAWGNRRCGQTRRMRGWAALAWARAVRDVDATLRRMRVELSGEAAGAVMPPPEAGRAVYEQRGGAGGREKQDKVQDVSGYKSEDRMLNGFVLKRAWSGRDGLDMSDLVAAQRRAAGWGELRLPKPAPKCPTVLGTLTPKARGFSYKLVGDIIIRSAKT